MAGPTPPESERFDMGNVTIDTTLLLDGLKGLVDIGALRSVLGGFSGLKIFQLPKQLAMVIAWAVAQVERLVEEVREVGDTEQYGSAKRDAVVKFFDEVVKLPFWLEPLDGPLIGFAVDAIVGALNVFLGKEWRSKVETPILPS